MVRNRHIGRLFLSWEKGDNQLTFKGPNKIVRWWFQVGPLMVAWDKPGAPK